MTFPATLGLSVRNYYEGTHGDNDFIGYVSLGARASLPVPVDAAWGKWAVSAGVQALFMGDAAASFNADHAHEFIATVGISVGF